MFMRRLKLSPWARLRTLLFPPGGWRRAAVYLWRRLCRLPGTPRSIACGAAWGVTIAISPFWGLHLWLALGLTWLSRGSLVAAGVFTLIGNPWTFPLFVAATFQTGRWLLPASMQPPALHLSRPSEAFATLLAHPVEMFLPMLIGWLPIAIVVWAATFWLARGAVAEYHRRRHAGRDRAPRAVAVGNPGVAE